MEKKIAVAVLCVFVLCTAFIWSMAYIAYVNRSQVVCKTVDLGLEGKATECHVDTSKAKWFKGKPTKEDFSR